MADVDQISLRSDAGSYDGAAVIGRSGNDMTFVDATGGTYTLAQLAGALLISPISLKLGSTEYWRITIDGSTHDLVFSSVNGAAVSERFRLPYAAS